MQVSNVFYIVGSLSLLAITVLLGILVYEIYVTLKALQTALDRADSIVGDVRSVTSGMQFGFWALLTKLFGGLSGRR